MIHRTDVITVMVTGILIMHYSVLLYGKLRDFFVLIGYIDWRARWSDTARPGLLVSFPQIKFRQSSNDWTKVFSR